MIEILNIYNGIADKLKDKFREVNRVNKIDELKARESSFFYLELVDFYLKRGMNNRMNKAIKFKVLYYSNKDEPNLDYTVIADRLYEVFDYVTYDKFIYKVNEKSFKVSKEGLEFNLEFINLSSIKKINYPYMKKLEEGVKVKRYEK